MALDEGYGAPTPAGGPRGGIGTPLFVQPRRQRDVGGGPLAAALASILGGQQQPPPLGPRQPMGPPVGQTIQGRPLGPFAPPLQARATVGMGQPNAAQAARSGDVRLLDELLAQILMPMQMRRVE